MSYWLTPPPGETSTGWLGKRTAIRDAGFGFLLLANGRLDQQIRQATQGPHALSPDAQGRADGQAAAAVARQEGFPAGAVLFVDQE